MNFHEYQAKELFAQYGIPVPGGQVASTPHDAVEAARSLGGSMWVVKAQVHAGGRGKAGGVKLVRNLAEVRTESERMLNMKISTYQTGGMALPVDCVLIAEAIDIESELYLSALVDRALADWNLLARTDPDVPDFEPDVPETRDFEKLRGLRTRRLRNHGSGRHSHDSDRRCTAVGSERHIRTGLGSRDRSQSLLLGDSLGRSH